MKYDDSTFTYSEVLFSQLKSKEQKRILNNEITKLQTRLNKADNRFRRIKSCLSQLNTFLSYPDRRIIDSDELNKEKDEIKLLTDLIQKIAKNINELDKAIPDSLFSVFIFEDEKIVQVSRNFKEEFKTKIIPIRRDTNEN